MLLKPRWETVASPYFCYIKRGLHVKQASFSVDNNMPLYKSVLPLYEKQKESEAKKKKKRELMEDYPEIVSKLTVFTGAGLPVRRAWERIVLEYEAACRAGTQTERAAYREMAAAYHRMQRGVPELQAKYLYRHQSV